MDTFITSVFVITDEVLKALQILDDIQSQMLNSEVVTFVIFSAKYHSGNHKLARYFCKRLNLFPKMLSNSRLNRRIHKLPKEFWNTLFKLLAHIFKNQSNSCEFAVDSFPVSSCGNNRTGSRKLFLRKQYIGYAASKKSYFCEFKVHMCVSTEGMPVEFLIKPASTSDVKVLWEMKLDIPECSILYADGAYNCFELEDLLKEERITLMAKRGVKARKRVRDQFVEKRISQKRQIVETVFSCITDSLPRNIRACTEHGFMLKLVSSILAFSFSKFIHHYLS